MNKLVDQHNNIYHHSSDKISINAGYSENTESNLKGLKFKVNDIVRITRYNNIFSKVYIENWSREIFFMDSVLKTNPWTYKIKDLNGGK